MIPPDGSRTTVDHVIAMCRTKRSGRVSAETFTVTSQSAPPGKRSNIQQTMKPNTRRYDATDISSRRVSLEENVEALGNAEGRATRGRLL